MSTNDLFKDLASIEGKSYYQQFICSIGIDSVLVTVPLKEASAFEAAAVMLAPTSRLELRELVEQYDGSLEEVK